MGPPPFDGGNLAKPCGEIDLTSTLQWGHRLSTVETGIFNLDRLGMIIASMGPPPFDGGNGPCPPIARCLKLPWLQWGHRLSTVETCFMLCGMAAIIWLQWGHRLSTVETATHYDMRWRVAPLQWGHRLSTVETGKATWSANGCWRSFNGATAFRRWKLVCGPPTDRPNPASMGPPPFDGGNYWIIFYPVGRVH